VTRRAVVALVVATTALVLGGIPAPRVRAHAPAPSEPVFTQAPFRASYAPPAPGTYELPPLKHVPGFTLLDSAGRRVSTTALTRGRLAVVSFIYTSCSDSTGCPLASASMRELQERLRDVELLGRVRLLSISVDPMRDRPSQLAQYARAFGADPVAWRFLTATSDARIRPVLDAYGQDRLPVHDERGRFTGAYRHVLKVFLVDERGFIRNVYSTGFLVPAVVVNDIATVLGESRRERR
jgi:cytochrome oxidase Cu insertion factor (SCO1/SenC/PrrC family)